MNTYGGADVHVYIHIFLTSALVGGEWSASRPGHFTSRNNAPSTQWIGGCVDPRASYGGVNIFNATATRTPTPRPLSP
jgi:hypothetical protein